MNHRPSGRERTAKPKAMLEQRKKLSGSFVAVSIVLFIAIFAWRLYSGPSGPALTDHKIAEEMKLRAKQAVDTAARDFGVVLDDSPESVEHVEAILAKLHARHIGTPFDDVRLTKEALRWGGYVGEVIKTQREAEWALDSRVGGEGSLPIAYGDKSESFPVRWCYKRIVNGDEDNVWHKFMDPS